MEIDITPCECANSLADTHLIDRANLPVTPVVCSMQPLRSAPSRRFSPHKSWRPGTGRLTAQTKTGRHFPRSLYYVNTASEAARLFLERTTPVINHELCSDLLYAATTYVWWIV